MSNTSPRLRASGGALLTVARGLTLAGTALTGAALVMAGCGVDGEEGATPSSTDAPISVTGQTFQNPVGAQGQDPSIIFQGGYYYYTQSTNNDLTVRRSPSLATLATAPPVTVWRAGQEGTPASELWAPELHFINGSWYIYYSADLKTNETHRVYAIQSASPFGPYTSAGKVSDPADGWAIDGTILQTPNGALYWLWAGSPLGIWIAPMSSPTHVSGPGVRISEPTLPWEKSGAPVNEGPEVLVRNGRVFVTYSASMCWTPDYELGLVTADLSSNLLNPGSWRKSQNPVFRRNDGAQVFGPGHNYFMQSPDGKEDWLIYHAVTNPAGNCDLERTVRAQPFGWNADGTPNLGAPVSLGAQVRLPSGDPGSRGPIMGPGNKCIDVSANSSANGAAVQLYDCNGVSGQQWSLEPDGTVRTNGKCLDINGNGVAAGTQVELWECNGAGGQKWAWQTNGSLRNPQSGKCLDSPNGSSANLTRLQIWDCNSAPAQRFAVPGVNGSIEAPGGTCVDVSNGDSRNGSPVQLWKCVGGDAQEWTPAFDGTLRAFGKCLDIEGNGSANGAKAQLWECNGAGGQVWQRLPNGALKNPQSGRCLDDTGGNTTPGTRLQIWDCNGAPAQVFHVNG